MMLQQYIYIEETRTKISFYFNYIFTGNKIIYNLIEVSIKLVVAYYQENKEKYISNLLIKKL